MTTSQTLTLRQALADFLDSRLSFDEFIELHSLALHQASLDDDRAALELSMSVELLIDEYENGDWTASELQDSLAALRSTYVIPRGTDDEVALESGTLAALIGLPITLVAASADRPPETVPS